MSLYDRLASLGHELASQPALWPSLWPRAAAHMFALILLTMEA